MFSFFQISNIYFAKRIGYVTAYLIGSLISLTVVIDASMERSSRVLQHGNRKNLISFQKRSKLNFDLCWSAEITQLRQYKSYSSNNYWYINGNAFTSTIAWKPKNLISFQKRSKLNFDVYFDLCWRAEITRFVNISPTVVIDTLMEMSLRVLEHENQKNIFSCQKRAKFNFNFWWSTEITLDSSISVLQ